MKKNEEKGCKLPSAFSFYSFEDIPLPVKRNQEKEEDKFIDVMIEEKKEEGYQTRARKKVKVNEEDKESSSSLYQGMVEENNFLNIDSRN